jgi:hypothetical protein
MMFILMMLFAVMSANDDPRKPAKSTVDFLIWRALKACTNIAGKILIAVCPETIRASRERNVSSISPASMSEQWKWDRSRNHRQ